MPEVGERRTNPNNPAETATWNGRRWVISSAPAPGGGRASSGPTTSGQTGMQLRQAAEAAAQAQAEMAQTGNFQDLNAQHETGGVYGVPGVGNVVADLQAPFDPTLGQMRSISARLTPQQRIPGSGTTSDRDLTLYERATPSIRNPRETNDAIINTARVEATRRQTRSAFFDSYAQTHGNLIGAQAAFEQFWSSHGQMLQQMLTEGARQRGGRRQAPRAGRGYTVLSVED